MTYYTVFTESFKLKVYGLLRKLSGLETEPISSSKIEGKVVQRKVHCLPTETILSRTFQRLYTLPPYYNSRVNVYSISPLQWIGFGFRTEG